MAPLRKTTQTQCEMLVYFRRTGANIFQGGGGGILQNLIKCTILNAKTRFRLHWILDNMRYEININAFFLSQSDCVSSSSSSSTRFYRTCRFLVSLSAPPLLRGSGTRLWVLFCRSQTPANTWPDTLLLSLFFPLQMTKYRYVCFFFQNIRCCSYTVKLNHYQHYDIWYAENVSIRIIINFKPNFSFSYWYV